MTITSESILDAFVESINSVFAVEVYEENNKKNRKPRR
jgi:hypothetical protein